LTKPQKDWLEKMMQTAFTDEIQAIHNSIAESVGEAKYKIWFRNSTRMTLTAESLEIAVPNTFFAGWIENHFARAIQNALKAANCPMAQVRVVVDSTLTPTPRQAPTCKNQSRAIIDIETPAGAARFVPPLKLTLNTFVVGQKNQLAYNAALNVVQEEKSPFNPLFYHGGYGVGKTHLLQGVCNEYARTRRNAKWIYVSAEDFANQYVLALKTRKLDVFRSRFRSLDLLVIDDIHFLANKNAMQEEFLHTFNSIDLAGKQLVLASDAHPKKIGQLCEKLVSRFVSGMVVRIDAPDFETRCEICRRRAAAMKYKISEDVISFLAGQMTGNVRELEGALLKLIAYASVSNQKVSLASAKELLADHILRADPVVHSSDITDVVARYFDITVADIHSPKKDRLISLARSYCMYMTRKLTKMSFPEIGKTLGGKNHATVILACRKIEEALESNQRLKWKNAGGFRNAPAKDILQELMEQIS
jgi:chromosomal replication initiator protein